MPFSTAETAAAGNWLEYDWVALPMGTTRIRRAFVRCSIVLLVKLPNAREAATGLALPDVLYWKLIVAPKEAEYDAVVLAGANAEPGTTNLMSAGASLTGATE